VSSQSPIQENRDSFVILLCVLQGLELNPRDCWSTHARAHIFEMTGRPDEGIEFMNKTLDHWSVCHMFSHIIYLFNLFIRK
jgi:hypothetical protein